MNGAIWAIVLLAGLLFGSFGNSVVYRLPRRLLEEWQNEAKESLGLPLGAPDAHLSATRSHCPQCKSLIAWYDNFPVLSWLMLRGKCRHCEAAIPGRYLLLELAGVAVAGGAYYVWGLSPQFVTAILLGFPLLWLGAIDLEHMLLPDKLVYPCLWLGFVAATQNVFVDPSTAIWGAVVGFAFLALPGYFFRIIRGMDGLGGGDAKLTAALGAFLGPMGILAAVFLGSVIAVLFHVFLRFKKTASRDTPMPFGPPLIIAGVIMLVSQHWHVLQNILPWAVFN